MIVTAQTSRLKGVANVIMLSTMVTSVFSTLFLKASDHIRKILSKTTVTRWPPSCSSRLQRQHVCPTARNGPADTTTSMWMFIPTRLYTMVTSTNLLSRNTSFLLFDRAWYIHFPYFYFIPENHQLDRHCFYQLNFHYFITILSWSLKIIWFHFKNHFSVTHLCHSIY